MGGGITGESVRRRTPISKEEKEKMEVRDGVRAKDTEVRAEKDTGAKEEREKDSEEKAKERGKAKESTVWI
jgi:hypothetical protein